MGASLPPGSQYPENRGILTREVPGRKRAARSNANALNNAVRQNGKGLACFGGKEQNETDPLISRRSRHFVFDDASALVFPLDNIRVNAQRNDPPPSGLPPLF